MITAARVAFVSSITALSLAAIATCLQPSGDPAPDPAAGSSSGPTAAPTVEGELASASPVGGGHDVMESAFCSGCHPAIYAEHEQSTHGRAFTDRGGAAGDGALRPRRTASSATPRGRSSRPESGLNPTRRYHGLEEGNTCMTCHWRPDYDYSSFAGRRRVPQGVPSRTSAPSRPARPATATTGLPTSGRRASDRQGDRARVHGLPHGRGSSAPSPSGGPVREVRSHVFPGSRSERQLRRAYAYQRRRLTGNAVGREDQEPRGRVTTSRPSSSSAPWSPWSWCKRPRGHRRSPARGWCSATRTSGRTASTLPVNTQIPGGETRDPPRPDLQIPESGTDRGDALLQALLPDRRLPPRPRRASSSRATIPFSGITPSRRAGGPARRR